MKDPLEPSPDQLDRLLGLSALPQPDPWFTARTMARCRLSDPTPVRGSFFLTTRFWGRWALPCLFVLFAGGLSLQQSHRIHTLKIHHRQDKVREAFEVMARMNKDSDTSWQDSSL